MEKPWPCPKCKRTHLKSAGCAARNVTVASVSGPRNVTVAPDNVAEAPRNVTRNVTVGVVDGPEAPRNVTVAVVDPARNVTLLARVAELEATVALLEDALDQISHHREMGAARSRAFRSRHRRLLTTITEVT